MDGRQGGNGGEWRLTRGFKGRTPPLGTTNLIQHDDQHGGGIGITLALVDWLTSPMSTWLRIGPQCSVRLCPPTSVRCSSAREAPMVSPVLLLLRPLPMGSATMTYSTDQQTSRESGTKDPKLIRDWRFALWGIAAGCVLYSTWTGCSVVSYGVLRNRAAMEYGQGANAHAPICLSMLTVCPSRIDNQLSVGCEFSCVCHVKQLSNFQCLGHSKL